MDRAVRREVEGGNRTAEAACARRPRRGAARRGGLGRDAGVSAVEFGLILPLLIVLLLGIMDYGWVYFVKLSLTNAAREGARVGVVQQDQASATTRAAAVATSYLQNTGINVPTGAVSATFNCPTVTVNINMPFTPLIGFVPTPSSLGANAAMRWELANAQDVCN